MYARVHSNICICYVNPYNIESRYNNNKYIICFNYTNINFMKKIYVKY